MKTVSFVLSGLPLPPSENECYLTRTAWKDGHIKAWRAPTKALEQYQLAMSDWRKEHLLTANAARRILVAPLPEHQQLIRVDRYFVFKRSRLWTLANRPKKLDASNRIKPFDDALASHILGLDDCWFWSGLAEKVEAGDNEMECTLVVLTPILPRTMADLMGESPDPTYAPPVVRQVQAALAAGCP